MPAPREQDSIGHRPRLSVVTSQPQSRQSGLGRAGGRRLPAHPLEFDERGHPVVQRPLSAAERLARLLTG
jgi:hypothetical protein